MSRDLLIRNASGTFSAALFAVTLLLIAGCENHSRPEKWVGTYTYSNDSPKFPIYFDLTIVGEHVAGRAFDGNMEEADITGNIAEHSYSLLLHPLKQGSSTDQDIRFRGTRSQDAIVGEWEHVVGVNGAWSAKATELPPNDAIRVLLPPCQPGNIADREATGHACAKDA
jgi:hypothetical protein